MDLIPGAAYRRAWTALGVVTKRTKDRAQVGRAELNIQGNGSLPMIFNNCSKSFDDPFCLSLPVGDILISFGKKRNLRSHLKQGTDGVGPGITFHGLDSGLSGARLLRQGLGTS